jgi:hypothetical protein
MTTAEYIIAQAKSKSCQATDLESIERVIKHMKAKGHNQMYAVGFGSPIMGGVKGRGLASVDIIHHTEKKELDAYYAINEIRSTALYFEGEKREAFLAAVSLFIDGKCYVDEKLLYMTF